MCDKTKELLNLTAAVDAIHDFVNDSPDKNKRIYKSENYDKLIDYIFNGIIEECETIDNLVDIALPVSTIENRLLNKIINFNDINELAENIIANDYQIDITTYNNRKYNIKMLHKANTSDIKTLTNNLKVKKQNDKLTKDDIDKFLNANTNIVVDASFINVFDLFLNIPDIEKLNINNICNRETINDSANSSDKLEGFNNLFDNNSLSKEYDKNVFNTKYHVTLGKLTRKIPDDVDSSFLSHFEIKDDESKIYDSKTAGKSTISNCIALFNRIRAEDKDKRSAVLQAKRSGDWLQAISCKDNKRGYINIETYDNESLDSIVLLTHDKVLLMYSLIIGIDVLFTTKTGRHLLHFQNSKKEKSLKTSKASNSENEKRRLRLESRMKRNPVKKGGRILYTAKERCINYLKELSKILEKFDSDEDQDYEYYEIVGCLALACIEYFRTDYNKIDSVLFDRFPSVEGYIRTDDENIIQFFKDDKTKADCVSFAARQVALASMNLRTGTIQSINNDKVKVPFAMVKLYTDIYSSLPSIFLERHTYLIDTIQKHLHVFLDPIYPTKKAYTRSRRFLLQKGTRKIHRNG